MSNVSGDFTFDPNIKYIEQGDVAYIAPDVLRALIKERDQLRREVAECRLQRDELRDKLDAAQEKIGRLIAAMRWQVEPREPASWTSNSGVDARLCVIHRKMAGVTEAEVEALLEGEDTDADR